MVASQPGRYPKREGLHRIFSGDPRTFNVIHFNSADPDKLLFTQLMAMVGMYHGHLEARLNGFQLNVCWPGLEHLEQFRKFTQGKYLRLILQLGEKALAEASTRGALVCKLREYREFVDYMLIDGSGGTGKRLDTNFCLERIRAVRDAGLTIGMGVAGGLSAETLHLVAPIIEEFPETSIDAEDRLRNLEDSLNVRAAAQYVLEALKLYPNGG
jgi:hypothetical protein